MSIHPIREFYSNGKIKFEYFRYNGDIRDLRCWDETGEPIPQKDLKYQAEDSDADLALRLQYICKKMPVPNFSRTQTSQSRFVVATRNGPYYSGVDF